MIMIYNVKYEYLIHTKKQVVFDNFHFISLQIIINTYPA